MLGTIVKKEILENLYSFKFVVITLLSVILVFISVLTMHSDYQMRMEHYEQLISYKEQSTSLLKPAPLSIFAKGLDESLCSIYKMSRIIGGYCFQSLQNQQSYNVLFKMFAAPDLFFLVKIVLSLCAILFSFNLVSGEKESGTLRLSLASSTDRAKLLAGKWIGGFSCVAFPALIAFLFGILLISLSADVQMQGEEYLKLLFLLVSCFLYLAFFFTLGLLASCFYKRSSSALIVSLFLWIVFVLVVPNLSGVMARKIVKIPSAQRLSFIKSQGKFEINDRMQNESLEIGAWGPFSTGYVYDLEGSDLIMDYRSRLNEQIECTIMLVRLSPVGVFTLMAADFSNTGILEMNKHKQAYLNYKNIFLEELKFENGNVVKDHPQFLYERSSLKEILVGGGLLNITLILLQNLVVFAGAYVLFLRYDVR